MTRFLILVFRLLFAVLRGTTRFLIAWRREYVIVRDKRRERELLAELRAARRAR